MGSDTPSPPPAAARAGAFARWQRRKGSKRLEVAGAPLSPRGAVEERSVPELLHRCNVEERSGVLGLWGEGRHEELAFMGGRLAYLESTATSLELGRRLRGTGRLSEELYQELAWQAEREGLSWSGLLLQRRVLDPHELYELLTSLITERALSCIGWRADRYTFSRLPAEGDPPVPLEVAVPRLLVDGLRQGWDEARIEELLALPDGARPYLRRGGREALDRLKPTTAEARLIAFAERGRPLGEIVERSSDSSRREVLALFAALFLMETAGFELDAGEEPAPTPSPRVNVRDTARELAREFGRLEGTEDYFILLGVRRSATTTAIRRAFRSRAKLCHPDALIGREVELRERGEKLFRQMTEAHELLTDGELREEYRNIVDRREAAAQPPPEPTPAPRRPTPAKWRTRRESKPDLLTLLRKIFRRR